jgi:hypothetical protein
MLTLLLMMSTLMLTTVGPDAGLIDDFATGNGVSRLGTAWRLVTDRVMGGRSDAGMAVREVDGRRALCMQGDVSLENNGGFVQVNIDLAPQGYLDASGFDGVRLMVRGNGEHYGVHLKTAATGMPWQSYRAGFDTDDGWREVRLPFTDFRPHRVDSPLELARLKRLGIVAIGRVMRADICIAEVGFYRIDRGA